MRSSRNGARRARATFADIYLPAGLTRSVCRDLGGRHDGEGSRASQHLRDQLRSRYIDFFKERGHAVIPSASIVPDRDGSVLFTTAGMHPLVPYLLGREHAAGRRLTNCQKCIRTNDIEEVGDLTHLTFFEMLGNWSLGDYYKQESITWSYEFLTGADTLAIPPELIWATVFAGNEDAPRDEEAARIWRSLGIPDARIVFLGAEDNWWAAGPEGPCGPDTEIFVDRTCEPCARGAKACLPGLCGCGRFFEIWNNVFMSYERRDGRIFDLPKKNVDTGMGLERTLAVLSGAGSVYDTDPLRAVVARILELAGRGEHEAERDPKLRKAVRVLADHIRTSTFILGDVAAVRPSNQGQGYVLRRLIRRAVRFCDEVGLEAEAWSSVSDTVIDAYAGQYPELAAGREMIRRELSLEIERFGKALQRGNRYLEKEVARARAAGERMLDAEVVFRLYDTYGFPVEFTDEIAKEAGLAVDVPRFRADLAGHQERSRTVAAKSGLADDSAESVRYHTATHLLHAALRRILGEDVQQRGSNINRERMRFDFSFGRAMTAEEVARVEAMVQAWIDLDLPVDRLVTTPAEAKAAGAIGLFDERYGEVVSVYRIGDVSMELCSGPHVERTSEIGAFTITKEQSSSAGIRRIRAELS